MKKIRFNGLELNYSNPRFRQLPIGEGDNKRVVTLCHVGIDVGHTMNNIGFAIMNPSDEFNTKLGETIAEGRALKNPISKVSLISDGRLPKAIIDEQFEWAAKHIERNLDEYVNNIRETLKG